MCRGLVVAIVVVKRGLLTTATSSFGLGASLAGLWAYGLGRDKKPAWLARRAGGLGGPGRASLVTARSQRVHTEGYIFRAFRKF